MAMSKQRAQALFGDMHGLEQGGAKNIKTGTYWALLNKVEEFTTRSKQSAIKAHFTVVHPVQDGVGNKVGDEGYAGHFKGEEFTVAFFFGDRFARDFSPFVIAGLGLTTQEAKQLKGDALTDTFGEIVREAGSQEPGCLDGMAVMQVRGEANLGKDKDGNEKTYINERFDRKVNISELADKLDEDDIVRFFGSFETFTELIEQEG